MLLVLTIMTSYKVGAAAVPFGHNMMEALTARQPIAEWVQNSFIMVSAIFFMMMATPALIYFKLLDRDAATIKERNETRMRKVWSLDYLTPRLPGAMVYGIVAWLLLVSSHGLVIDVNDPVFSAARFFEVYLPVFIEVALAVLVGNILEKRKAFSDLVRANIKETSDRIDAELESYASDPRYMKLMYRNLREFFLLMERKDGKQVVRPNAALEEDPQLDKYLVAEYKRLTGGEKFAAAVKDTTSEDRLLPIEPKGIAALRVPPNGATKWTVSTLLFDLKQRGLPAGYTEGQLREDYAPDHDARKAWRAGAKHYATSGI